VAAYWRGVVRVFEVGRIPLFRLESAQTPGFRGPSMTRSASGWADNSSRMYDAVGAETLRIFIGVGDIVAVRQENVSHSAVLFETARQLLHEAWQIN
jgi:hypothetical protein